MNCELILQECKNDFLSLPSLLLDSALRAPVRIEFISPFSGCIHWALLIEVKAAAGDKPTSYKTLCDYWIRCYYYIITFLIEFSFSFKNTCGRNLVTRLFTIVILQQINELLKSLHFLKGGNSSRWHIQPFGTRSLSFSNNVSVLLKTAAKVWQLCNFVLLKTFL